MPVRALTSAANSERRSMASLSMLIPVRFSMSFNRRAGTRPGAWVADSGSGRWVAKARRTRRPAHSERTTSLSISSTRYMRRLAGRLQHTSLPVSRSNSKPCHGQTNVDGSCRSMSSPGPVESHTPPTMPSADGCSLVGATVHDGAELAAVQADHPDFAPIGGNELHLTGREFVRHCRSLCVVFRVPSDSVTSRWLQPQGAGGIVEEHGLAHIR